MPKRSRRGRTSTALHRTRGQRLRLLILGALANALNETGQLSESLDLSRVVLEACERGDGTLDSVRARTLSRIAVILIRRGQSAESLRHHAAAIRRWQSLRDLRGGSEIVLSLAEAEGLAARSHRMAGQLEKSHELLMSARRALDGLSSDDSLGVKGLWRQARSLHDLGVTEFELGRQEHAKSALVRARSILEELNRRDPQNARWRALLSQSHMRLADIHKSQGEFAEAEGALKIAMEIAGALADVDQHNLLVRKALHATLERQGDLLMVQQSPAEALDAYKRSAKLMDEILASQKSDLMLESDRALATWKLGDALHSLGRLEAAIAHFDRATAKHRELMDADPKNFRLVDRLIWSHYRTGDAWAALKKSPSRLYRATKKGLPWSHASRSSRPKVRQPAGSWDSCTGRSASSPSEPTLPRQGHSSRRRSTSGTS